MFRAVEITSGQHERPLIQKRIEGAITLLADEGSRRCTNRRADSVSTGDISLTVM